MNVLIVEDSADLADAIQSYLIAFKHQGSIASNLKDAKKHLDAMEYSAIILDINLPDGNGMNLIQHAKRKKYLPAIIITTAKHQIEDRIEGLNMGADDYLTKPYELSELLARINAIQRRLSGNKSIQINDIEINLIAKLVTLDNEPLNLTNKEWLILERLCQTPNHIVNKNQLTDAVYANENFIDSNTLEVHISSLRKKMGPDLIQTIRGLGYRIKTLCE